MTVLVVGATGKTGRPVVDALVGRGVQVRAASRKPEAATAGVEPVRFDWADRSTWAPALHGIDSLYVVGPYAAPDEPGLVGDLLAAAGQVRKVVLLSVLGVDQLPDAIPMAAWERDVRASGMEWTIVRPNWFQQNFGEGFAASLREHGELALPADDAVVGFVDTRDIAEVAVAALAEEGHAGAIHIVTGPAALTLRQVTQTLGEAAGRELRYTALPADQFADGLRTAGLDERSITWQLGLFRLIRDGGNAVVTDTVERITGHPARDLESYARENAGIWR
ncbi:NAD(P)H-binding protein [Nocardia barduliensis]|uniref:NAD(P)H-binding protein n=1 Tax=Nocardia barduliensis TaxID=2736643 RepID=UPI001574949B|nr:NAD(P)H-binding protein [Nocardia barduliensis]